MKILNYGIKRFDDRRKRYLARIFACRGENVGERAELRVWRYVVPAGSAFVKTAFDDFHQLFRVLFAVAFFRPEDRTVVLLFMTLIKSQQGFFRAAPEQVTLHGGVQNGLTPRYGIIFKFHGLFGRNGQYLFAGQHKRHYIAYALKNQAPANRPLTNG